MAIQQHPKTGIRYINIRITDPRGWFGKPEGYEVACVEHEALRLIKAKRAVDIEEENKKAKTAKRGKAPANKMATVENNK